MLHGVTFQADGVAEFGQADKPAPHAAIAPCCAKSCQALAAAIQVCIGSNAALGEAAAGAICPKGVKFPKGERLVAAARNASNGSVDRPAGVAVPESNRQTTSARMPVRLPSVVPRSHFVVETTLPCNSGGHRSLAHFEKASVAFRRKRKWRSKSNKEVIPQSLSISVLLHRSNNGLGGVTKDLREPGRSPTAGFADLAQHSACRLEQRHRPKWLRLL